jgi:hypothetical protein
MRDIRQDLRDRLAEIDAEISGLQQDREAIAILLGAEERRWSSQTSESNTRLRLRPITTSTKAPAVRDVINELLSHNNEAWSTATLANAAISRGCDFGGSRPGRAVQGILLGMLNSGRLQKDSDGRWRVAQAKSSHRHDDASPSEVLE